MRISVCAGGEGSKGSKYISDRLQGQQELEVRGDNSMKGTDAKVERKKTR